MVGNINLISVHCVGGDYFLGSIVSSPYCVISARKNSRFVLRVKISYYLNISEMQVIGRYWG